VQIMKLCILILLSCVALCGIETESGVKILIAETEAVAAYLPFQHVPYELEEGLIRIIAPEGNLIYDGRNEVIADYLLYVGTGLPEFAASLDIEKPGNLEIK